LGRARYLDAYVHNEVADNTTDKAVVTTRLLKNYDDMADAMKPYYGNDTGSKFGDLIEEHLLIAAALVEAAKAETIQLLLDARRNGMRMRMRSRLREQYKPQLEQDGSNGHVA